MGYTVKVSNVSLAATERDIYDFFAFSGEIGSIQTKPCGPEAPGTQVAYVTFQDERSLETALLLTGAIIVDKPVSVELVEGYVPPPTSAASAFAADGQSAASKAGGEDALKKAEAMMANLLANGYILSKDAMERARALDSKHELSATARLTASHAAGTLSRSAAELNSKYQISEKLAETGATVTRSLTSVDEKYHVTTRTREAISAAEASLSGAGQALMQNPYVSSGTSWLMGALGQLKTIVADVQQQTQERVTKAEEERGVGQRASSSVGQEEDALGSPAGEGKKEGPPGLGDQGPAVTPERPAPAPAVSLMDAPAPAFPTGPVPAPAPAPTAKPALSSYDPVF